MPTTATGEGDTRIMEGKSSGAPETGAPETGALETGALETGALETGALGKRFTWPAASRYAYQAPTALTAEPASLENAVNRMNAVDLMALCDVPHYASSAMDGWAVAGDEPWKIVRAEHLEPGQAVSIVTGGLVPAGADGILRTEHADVGQDDLDVEPGSSWLTRNGEASPDPRRENSDIRLAGVEVTQSECVITAGTVLNPAHIGLAAVCGHDEISVVRVPQVTLILTGDEVVDSGIPEPGHVRDTFGPQLPALMPMMGGKVSKRSHVPDDLDALISALRDDDSDLIITTGGTGGSSADHLHTALHDLGAEILIDGIAMRPGSPTLLARLPGGCHVVGLPGNPLAAMIGMLTLARPLLAAMGGAAEPATGSTTIGHDVTGHPTSHCLSGYVMDNGFAMETGWFGSGMMRGIAAADGILIVPPGGALNGAHVETIPLPWKESRG